MAREISVFSVTVPAGTAKAAPQVTDLAMAPREVDFVEVVVPPGPAGHVGFYLGAAGSQIIPHEVGTWLVTDDETIHWPLEGQINSGAWQMTAYNTGTYDHTLEVRFGVRPAAGPGAAPLRRYIPAQSLSG